jgi:hypothetical protein
MAAKIDRLFELAWGKRDKGGGKKDECPNGGDHRWVIWSGKFRCSKCGTTSNA